MDRFGSQEARQIWEGQPSKAARRILPSRLHAKTAAMIDRVLNTATLRDCFSYPPGWRFKELHGRLRGTYQVRIDGQYRLRFQWDSTRGAIDLVVGDFHGEDE